MNQNDQKFFASFVVRVARLRHERKRSACFLSLIVLASCASTEVSLNYAPTAPLPSPSADPVVAVKVVDDRGGDPHGLGVARGVLGQATTPLATGHTTAREVEQAVIGALSSRGLLAPVGAQRFDMTVRIVGLSGQERLGQVASADLVVSLARHDDGRVVFTDEAKAFASRDGVVSGDSLAFVSTADIAGLTNHVMNAAIDQALDKPGLRAALRAT